MREIRPSGSEGGGTEFNRFSLPLSFACRFGQKHLVIAPGIRLRTVALGNFLGYFGVVLPRRPHTDRKRAQHGARRQRWFGRRVGVRGCISYVFSGTFPGRAGKTSRAITAEPIVRKTGTRNESFLSVGRFERN